MRTGLKFALAGLLLASCNTAGPAADADERKQPGGATPQAVVKNYLAASELERRCRGAGISATVTDSSYFQYAVGRRR